MTKSFKITALVIISLGVIVSIALLFVGSPSKWFSKPSEVASITSPGLRVAYENCMWGEVSGAGLQIWAQQCDYGDRQVRVAPSETLPGYFVETKVGNNEWTATSLAIQIFTLGKGQTIDALLPLATTGLNTYTKGATCAFALSSTYSVEGKKRYILVPTGKTKEVYDLASKNSTDIPAPPCGDFGINADSSGYFEVQDAHPNTVLYINIGQELPLFDEAQITVL